MLDRLRPAPGSRHREKRVGRGIGSGHGKTSTKGHKGQGARSGGTKGPGFEGGQQPLTRRLPKGGFVPPNRETPAVVNLGRLNEIQADPITIEVLKAEGLVRRSARVVKILGDGTVTRPKVVQAHRFSRSAVEKLQAAGGRAEVVAE